MVVDHMTRGNCIPIDSVKSIDIVSVFFIILGVEHVLIRIRSIRHTWLVKIMIYRVGKIRKSGRGVTWITIKIEKIVVISHITQETSNTNKEKQTNKKKNLT